MGTAHGSSAGMRWLTRLGEGLTIVLSILFAFGIDAWWASRQHRNAERAYLLELQSELQLSQEELEDELAHRRQVLASVDELFAVFDGVRPPPGGDSLAHLVGGMRYPKKFAPPRAALDELIAVSTFDLIKSENFRLHLRRYSQELAKAQVEEREEHDFIQQELTPFLGTLLSLRVAAVDVWFPGIQQTPPPLGPRPLGRGGVWSDLVFENLLAVRREKAERLINRQQNIQRMITELLPQVQDALGTR